MPISPETQHPGSCPLTTSEVAERYFFEHRAKMLDIAAWLDRLDRCIDAETAPEDIRIAWANKALEILTDGKGNRTQRIHEYLSDLSADPIDATPGKSAQGCPINFPNTK